jgi:hypothetical protein
VRAGRNNDGRLSTGSHGMRAGPSLSGWKPPLTGPPDLSEAASLSESDEDGACRSYRSRQDEDAPVRRACGSAFLRSLLFFGPFLFLVRFKIFCVIRDFTARRTSRVGVHRADADAHERISRDQSAQLLQTATD